MTDENILPTDISVDQFHRLLSRYAPLIASISSAKGAKPGQKPLLELDKFRYEDVIADFQSEKPRRQMAHEDVKVLVDWKLRHGKFRPTLMKLVSSNDETVVEETIQKAMTDYWATADASKALDAIAKLKGIGPATASLLLSVHDPDRVIFFSDEAFYWLCCDGRKSPIKYTAREYRDLNTAVRALANRLGASATDIEKVAYVLMKERASEQPSVKGQLTPSTETKTVKAGPAKPAKRNSSTVASTGNEVLLRRSKRARPS